MCAPSDIRNVEVIVPFCRFTVDRAYCIIKHFKIRNNHLFLMWQNILMIHQLILIGITAYTRINIRSHMQTNDTADFIEYRKNVIRSMSVWNPKFESLLPIASTNFRIFRFYSVQLDIINAPGILHFSYNFFWIFLPKAHGTDFKYFIPHTTDVAILIILRETYRPTELTRSIQNIHSSPPKFSLSSVLLGQ